MRRIIIVDDESHITRVLKLALDRAGYQVIVCPDGVDALDAIREKSPDVLVTDIQMPRMTGKELCHVLKDELPDRDFPIYVMTSMADREHREWVEPLSNVFFLEKPLSMRILLQKLGAYFDEIRSRGDKA
ncbi:MAG: response regulator [Betaproteobacteria bacterium]|jgi:DNA-binding response OmpR family regulator|nr:response regulator [Betaproteobacteria bacterium]MBP7780128.1 response regulator [Burkholderiaceae bacterium]